MPEIESGNETLLEREQPIEKIIKGRKEKLDGLRASKVEPYPAGFNRTHATKDITESFSGLKPGETSAETVSTCGRMVLRREMGKAAFANLMDHLGGIQIYLRSDAVGKERFDIFAKLVDIGDFIGVEGTPFRTRTGEITVAVKSWTMLSKALRPLPEKWHGLKDVETGYRQRYLDLLSNESSRKVFAMRSSIISALRKYLDSKGFLEVETPVMQPVPGGALARPFVTKHNAYDMDLYLRIAPELWLKKLIVGGLDKVYELGKSFRNEGVDRHHNPEFTMLEIYEAYSSCGGMIALCKGIMRYLAENLEDIAEGQKQKLSGFREVKLADLSRETMGLDIVQTVTEGKIRDAAARLGVKAGDDETDKKVFDHIFDQLIQPKLKSPTFVTGYPLAFSPLAKKTAGNDLVADRFELFIDGQEVANAYSELNDPEEQRKRFFSGAAPQDAEEHHLFDKDFIEALEYGMPPCGGLGIGIDRLTMVLAGAGSIRDVILFPLLRPEGG
jgi:lysyl-tRNA synthetase class 2